MLRQFMLRPLPPFRMQPLRLDTAPKPSPIDRLCVPSPVKAARRPVKTVATRIVTKNGHHRLRVLHRDDVL